MESVIELEQLTSVVCQAIADNKGTNIAILDVEEVSPVGGAIGTVHSQCYQAGTCDCRFDFIDVEKATHQRLPYGVEGRGVDVWVLLDYGSLIVHIFQPETREYYDLDGLWMEAPRLPLEDFGVEVPEP